jgi:subtilisin-like proprotein convertase family protein
VNGVRIGIVAGLVLMLIGGGVAEAKKKSKKTRYGPAVTAVFTNGAINLPIAEPPLGSMAVEETSNRMFIPKRGKVLDVNVGVRISHTDTTELDFNIAGKNFLGAELSLANPRNGIVGGDVDYGAGAPDCTGSLTIFDAEAPADMNLAVNPYVGSYIPTSAGVPSDSLKVFRGADLRGQWTFGIGDSHGNGRAGVLHCWQLTVSYKPQLKKKKKRGKKSKRAGGRR